MNHFAAQAGISAKWRETAVSEGFVHEVVGQPGIDRHPPSIGLYEAQLIAGLAPGFRPLNQEEPASWDEQLAQSPGIWQVGPDLPAIDLDGDPKAVVAYHKATRHQFALDLHRHYRSSMGHRSMSKLAALPLLALCRQTLAPLSPSRQDSA